MTSTTMTDPVVLSHEIQTANGKRFGLATLNAPGSLNALSLEMVDLLDARLAAWAADSRIAGVVLDGAGGKAFCAGGDVVSLAREILDLHRREPGAAPQLARDFFEREYRLDHRVHGYPKPLLAWGHGIVMGGGVGLMAGASHRVVTPQSRVAMPEIGIGLYPDVGGSWFLSRAPGRTGLFLALTGAPLNAADAIFCGLADLVVAHERKARVLDAIAAHAWQGDAGADRAALSRLLAKAGEGAQKPPSKLREHFDTINELMAGDDLIDIANRLCAFESGDAWLRTAATTFVKGAPSSAALSFELWRRARRMSLAEVFRLEYWASLGCCAHSDFAEGIRALLIDKDRKPRWSPATIEEITPEFIEDCLRARDEGPHPLAALA
jgi:enoyl-CoA hydratase/carnithine racemase